MSLINDNSFTDHPRLPATKLLEAFVIRFSTGEGVEIGYDQDHFFRRVSYRPAVDEKTVGATMVNYRHEAPTQQDTYLGERDYFAFNHASNECEYAHFSTPRSDDDAENERNQLRAPYSNTDYQNGVFTTELTYGPARENRLCVLFEDNYDTIKRKLTIIDEKPGHKRTLEVDAVALTATLQSDGGVLEGYHFNGAPMFATQPVHDTAVIQKPRPWFGLPNTRDTLKPLTLQ